MAILRKGYAVGGDDTEWRRYINERLSELQADISKSKPRFNGSIDVCPTSLHKHRKVKPVPKSIEEFQDTISKLIDSTLI